MPGQSCQAEVLASGGQMIVDLEKHLLIGAKEDLDHFFELAQEHGFMEFLSISGKKVIEQPITVQSLLSSIKILRKQPLKEPYLGGGDLPFAMQIAERILELKDDIEKLQEERRLLMAEVSRVAPFGDFSMDDITYIERQGKRKIQFFCMKTGASQQTNFTDEIIYIATEYDLDYFITINRDSTTYPGMIEMRIDSPVGELQGRLSYVEDAIHRFESELKEYAGHIDFLHDILLEELNKYHLTCAKKEVSYPLQNSLFAIEAWVPQNRTTSLFALLDGMAVHNEQISIEKDERIPTHMENKGYGMIGEDLVKVFDIPAVTDTDPSSWVLWFFALFFAVIVSDAGYGFIFLGLAFYFKYKFPHLAGTGKRMLKLFFLLSTACIIWGVLTASYFGLKLAPDNVLNKVSIVHYLAKKKAEYHMARKDDVYDEWVAKYSHLESAQTSQQFIEGATIQKGQSLSYHMMEDFSSNILLEFAILIAIIHLSVSFFRYLRRHIAGLGWVIFMVGGYLFFPSVVVATSLVNFMGWIDKKEATVIGIQLIYGGIGFALIAAVIQKRLKGLSEIANMIQVFADALSYLRLYALSMAASIMAETVNNEGAALGLVAGAVIIFAGHCMNIGLGLMGGIVHGLRLNFLEWYHYCFEGGGKLFKPLKKLKRS